MTMAELTTLVLSFFAGALSTLSPCVLPLLPIVLLGALETHKWGPMALAGGLSCSFAVLGILISSIGFGLGLDPASVRLGVAALMTIFGIALLAPSLHVRLASVTGPIAAGGQALLDRFAPSGTSGQLLIGILLGAVWVPCSGPTLGAAIGLAAQSATMGKAALTMNAFALGAATPLLAIAYGSRQAVRTRCNGMDRFSRVAKPLMASTLILLGAFVLTGLDKSIETSLTRAMPDWLLNLTTQL